MGSGSRTDTIGINKDNWQNIIWEIYSDKYTEETFFTYEIKVKLRGPNPITDDPIKWQSPEPIKVTLTPGSIKKIGALELDFPLEPPSLTDKIQEYVKASLAPDV